MRDFYAYIQGTKKNPLSYEQEYLVQKVLYKVIGREPIDDESNAG